MANPHKRRLNTKGRREKAIYMGIPLRVIRSKEFGQLGGWEVKLLIELAAQYNGYNNGNLSCPFSQLKERGWNSNGTLFAARNRLLECNWIVTSRHGNRKRCALFALTWLSVDECEGKGLEILPTKTQSDAWKKTRFDAAIRTECGRHADDKSSEGDQIR